MALLILTEAPLHSCCGLGFDSGNVLVLASAGGEYGYEDYWYRDRT